MLPSPQSSGDAPSRRSRPIKLRNACNQCCASKVKCSGEKTGCERCRNTGSQCIFEESRVGKVPGTRARKKKDLGPESPRQQNWTRTSLSADSIGSAITATGDIGARDHAGPDTVMVWTNEWNFGGPDASSISQSIDHSLNEGPSGSSESTGASIMDEDYSPILYPGFEELLMQDPATNAQKSEDPADKQRSQMPVSLGRQPRSEIDSQCLLECSQMITELETYIMSDLKAFKIIMEIVKKALEKMSQLVRLQEASSNLRCLFLFTTLTYQILELLEVCVGTAEAERERQKGSKSAQSSLFTFGDFSVDAEEQSTFRVQKMLKEIQHGNEIVTRLRGLAGTATGQDRFVSGPRVAAGDCHLDLEMRFKALATRLENDR